MTKSTGILVRRYRLTESSLIVHWCTPTHGWLKTVAKGALRPGSPFAGRLDLFYSADIEFARSRKSDLHTLRDAAVTAHRAGLGRDYRCVQTAAYFIQLLELVIEHETPIPELYDLLRRALDFLELHPPGLGVILHFETELTRALGIEPAAGRSAIEVIRRDFHSEPAQRARLVAALDRSPPRSEPGSGGG